MNKTLISIASIAVLLAACQPVREQEPVEAAPVAEGPAATVPANAGDQGTPPRGARNVFVAYATGVDGVVVLVDRDTGCEWVGTQIGVQHQGSYGYTSIVPRAEAIADSNGGRRHKCRGA